MYVFIRLFKVILVSFFKPKCKPFDKVITTLRAWPNDIDYNFHINNGRYLTLMDIGRTDLTVRTNLYKLMMKKGWFPVVGQSIVNYRRAIKTFQKFEIHSQLQYWDKKWMYLKQDFYVDGSLYTSAYIKALFRKNGRSIPSQEIFDEMDLKEEKPRLPPESLASAMDKEVFSDFL